MTLEVWAFVLIVVFCVIVGLVAGFFGARALMKKELKKNPPTHENMIRARFM